MTACEDLAVPDYPISSGDRVLITGTTNASRGFDFSKTREVRAGATVASAVIAVSPSSGLSTGTVSIASNVVSFPVTASTEGEYCVTCSATLSTGAVLKMCGRFIVRDC